MLRSNGVSCRKIKWWAIYANVMVNAIVRLPHPRNSNSQGQNIFLVSSADNQTRNYDTECSNHHPSLSTLKSKGLSRRKMKWWAIYTNLQENAIVRLPHSRSGDCQVQETVLAPPVYWTISYASTVLLRIEHSVYVLTPHFSSI